MKLVVIGDLHYPTLEAGDDEARQIRDELYGSFFRIIAEEKPDAYICCGDLTNSGEKEDLLSLLRLTAVLPAPLYSVFGNHDTHGCSKEEFCRLAGMPPYYSVHMQGAKLIFLDTTMEGCVDDWMGVMDDAQQLWLEREMRNSGELPVALIAHHPIANTTRRSDERRLQLETDLWPILAQKCHGLYLNGHNHYHSIAEQGGWLFVQTGDFLSHLDYRTVELEGDSLKVQTHALRSELGGTDRLAPKMKRYTLYTDLQYDEGELSWEGDISHYRSEKGGSEHEASLIA